MEASVIARSRSVCSLVTKRTPTEQAIWKFWCSETRNKRICFKTGSSRACTPSGVSASSRRRNRSLLPIQYMLCGRR